MKNLFILSLLMLFSCSDDSGNSTTSSNNNSSGTISIIGTWKLTSKYDGNNPIPVSDCDANYKFKFNNGNTYYWTTPTFVNNQCEISGINGNYNITGNVIKIENVVGWAKYTIVELTNSTLKLKNITSNNTQPVEVYLKQ